ncbi:RNA polymerase recycling motor ATPase HelR [Brachybacterium sp. AOP43-C2-M15]|uniref:RNA polymerase recycling motor ATPase HelR n=1 Tax=Brachybacterium sp. AOP43-C2-M15 TaxID=3457661 RepID=UPI00403446E6
MTRRTGSFDLPAHLAHKAAPHRIGADGRRLADIDAALEADIDAVERRLEDALAHPAADAQGRVEREASVDHFRRRLRGLQGFRRDAVLGRMTPADGGEPVYIGRLGVRGADGRPLLVDWRSEVAAPFFSATRAEPMGLASRRRYRWAGEVIRDYWDEALVEGAVGEESSPDEESALLAVLEQARTPRMRSVLSTLAADQDAIIRASSTGPLVVDGGPGTGKTVVALHRAAYLLYSDPRLAAGRGRVLVVGPHHPYLHYVADVLPSLGEDGVRTCTIEDMVPEGAEATPESDPEVAALKGSRAMLEAIELAVALYEEPPTEPCGIHTGWGSVDLEAEDWAEAFAAVDRGTAHNLAREQLWEELAEIVAERLGAQYGEHPPPEDVRAALERDQELVRTVHRAWPLLHAPDLVGDLYEVPAYLRRCAPALDGRQRQLLRREDPRAWTVADLPLLDAARHRLGDPGHDARSARHRAAQQELVDEVALTLDELIDADSSEMRVMSMLGGEDLRSALADRVPLETPAPDELAGPFTHIVVDEAQELDDARWAMIRRRCPSGSLTLVGDRAQASDGFVGSWQERLARVGLERARVVGLGVNYRTPAEIMEQAAPVIRAALPDANVPTSIRESGLPVREGRVEQLEQVVEEWLAAHEEGTVAVIGASGVRARPRVQVLTPRLAKGLEVDLVVLVDPERFSAPERYVAMTRATQELVVLGR